MRFDEWVVTVQNVSVVCNDARDWWDLLRMIVQAQQVVVDDDDVPTHWTTNYAFPLINNHISSIGCIQNHDDRKCMYYMREFVFGGWSDDDVDVYQVDGCGWWMPDDEQNEGNFLKLCQSNDCGKFIIFGLYSLMGIWADIIVVGMGRRVVVGVRVQFATTSRDCSLFVCSFTGTSWELREAMWVDGLSSTYNAWYMKRVMNIL